MDHENKERREGKLSGVLFFIKKQMTTQELQTIKQRVGIIGSSPMLDRDIEIAAQVAVTDLSVLITGESGVGKEHFPQIIQYHIIQVLIHYIVDAAPFPALFAVRITGIIYIPVLAA